MPLSTIRSKRRRPPARRSLRICWPKGAWSNGGYRLFYNVNFPPVPAAGVKGIKIAAQGLRPDTKFSVESHLSPAGRKFLWIKGAPQDVRTEPGTDVAANLDGYTSVTPMRGDLTAHDVLGALRKRMG